MQQIRYALISMVRSNGVRVATACRVLKISRPTAYKWLHRYDADPGNGLRDRSRRPHSSPLRLREDVRKSIIDLHRATGLGPRALRRRLAEISQIVPATSTIYRVLKAAEGAGLITKFTPVSISSLENLCLQLLNVNRCGGLACTSLEATTIQQLVKIIRSGTIRERKRAALVALQVLGERRTKSAQLVRSSRRSAKKYWQAFESIGIESLVNASRISSKTDKEEVRITVFRLLHTPPHAHGFNRATWRLEDLNAQLRRQRTPVSTQAISAIIRSAGYQWKKARRVLTSNDPDYRHKLERIQTILGGLQNDERFFSIDEFGPIVVRLHGGKRLVAPGECPTVPQFQASKGQLLLIAALELSSNQLTHFYAERKNTDEIIHLLDMLLKQYRNCRKLYMSWDAASWHASRTLVSKVWEVNTANYRHAHRTPEIELVPLPAGAQFLNVIESVFSGMARAIIHNSDYESVEQTRAAVDRYIGDRNEHFRQHPKRAGLKIWGKERVVSAFSDGQNCKDPRW